MAKKLWISNYLTFFVIVETSRNHVKSSPLRLSGWSVVNIIIDSCRCHVASEGERGGGVRRYYKGLPLN